MGHPPTIFLDIDGTILKYQDSLYNITKRPAEVLDGVYEALDKWESMGCRVILTTGRKESMRALTEKQLADLGIYYDMLIMGLGGGPRYLINDKKPEGQNTAFAFNIERNGGLSEMVGGISDLF